MARTETQLQNKISELKGWLEHNVKDHPNRPVVEADLRDAIEELKQIQKR